LLSNRQGDESAGSKYRKRKRMERMDFSEVTAKRKTGEGKFLNTLFQSI